jgi:hypothetical protein
MSNDKQFEKLSDIMANKITKKPPAYQWQELALKIIKDLAIPIAKKNSVFKACKIYPKSFVEKCYNDTKELCHTGEKWKYFFKIIGGKNNS